MPFTSQICDTAFKFDVTVEGTSHVVSYLIGHDKQALETYFALVSLNYSDPNEPEYQFAIVRRSVPENLIEFLFDGRETKNLFSREDRYWILFVIISATIHLLLHCRPKRVFRCIMVGNDHAHAKALSKHRLVSWAFTRVGYVVRECDEFNGTQLWYAELAESGDERSERNNVERDCASAEDV